MKSSKIFLGVTTCLLAVVGVIAAKRYDQSKQRWYCTRGDGIVQYCVKCSVTCVTKLTGPILKTCTVNFGNPIVHAPVYLIGPPEPLPCDGVNYCIVVLKYTRNN